MPNGTIQSIDIVEQALKEANVPVEKVDVPENGERQLILGALDIDKSNDLCGEQVTFRFDLETGAFIGMDVLSMTD